MNTKKHSKLKDLHINAGPFFCPSDYISVSGGLSFHFFQMSKGYDEKQRKRFKDSEKSCQKN